MASRSFERVKILKVPNNRTGWIDDGALVMTPDST